MPTATLDRKTNTAIKWSGPSLPKVHNFGPGQHRPSEMVGVFAPTISITRRQSQQRRSRLHHLLSRRADRLIDATEHVTVVKPEELRSADLTRFVANRRSTVTCQIDTITSTEFSAVYFEPDRGFRRVHFRMTDIPRNQHHLVVPRAEFHWSVGQEKRDDGRYAVTSVVRFVRHAQIPDNYWTLARARGRSIADKLGIDLINQ
jgi:hypothetical protein